MSLSLVDVRVKRGTKEVLKGITLEVEPGQIVMVLGPNGTGKSTLLHAICGQAPYSGQAVWNQASITSLSSLEKAGLLAFVPQKEKHAFSYSLGDLVGMGRLAVSRGIFETAEDRKAVSEALARVSLAGFEQRSLLEVSGGELQLSLIARALVQNAPLLLLDEPTASLDLARHGLLAAILKEEQAKGRAVLAATHDLNWALALADRLVLLKSGKVLWQGSPADSQAALEECFEVRLEWLVRPEGPRVLPLSHF